MSKTINQVASECGVSYQKVLRYINRNMQDSRIDRTHKPFVIDDDLATEILDYFNNDHPREEVKQSTNDLLVDSLRQQVDILQNQLDIANEELKRKNQQIDSLLDSLNNLSNTNRGLAGANALHVLEDKISDNVEEEQEIKQDVPHKVIEEVKEIEDKDVEKEEIHVEEKTSIFSGLFKRLSGKR